MNVNAIVTRFSMEIIGADGTTERKLYFRHMSFLEIHGDKAVFNKPIVEYHVDELDDHTATLSYEADDGRKLIVRIDQYDESVQANPFNPKSWTTSEEGADQ